MAIITLKKSFIIYDRHMFGLNAIQMRFEGRYRHYLEQTVKNWTGRLNGESSC